MTLFDGQGRRSYLSREQEAALSTRLSERLMRDRGEMAACIAATRAVIYAHSGCLKLLHCLGFEYRRPESLPAGPGRPPLSRPITRCGAAWRRTRRSASPMPCTRNASPARPMAGSGRATRGVEANLGTPAPQPPRRAQAGKLTLPPVAAERVDAASTIALLEKLEASNPGNKQIHVIADNARHHHARLVRLRPDQPSSVPS